MKLKSVLGAVLAGALALGSTLAYAQAGPIYLTPKLLYSNQSIKSFHSTTSGSITSNFRAGDASDSVFGGGVAIGYDFGAAGYSPFRAELEFLARGGAEADFGTKTSGVVTRNNSPVTSTHGLKTKAYTLFANVYYDFANNSNFTPYIGGGIGGSYLDTTATITMQSNSISGGTPWSVDGNQTTWNFAWNLGGGVAYQLSDTMALDLGYRYTNLGKAESSSRARHYLVFNADPLTQHNFRPKTQADLSAHEFILGLRISGY